MQRVYKGQEIGPDCRNISFCFLDCTLVERGRGGPLGEECLAERLRKEKENEARVCGGVGGVGLGLGCVCGGGGYSGCLLGCI